MSNNYHLSPVEIISRLLIAAILGSAVGWERQRKDGTAGLRTHMLVCVGATLVMIVSAFGFDDILGKPSVVLDPSRIAAQVISGIGFLGAGTIFFLRPQIIRGLTTAAGLWTVAAVGLAVGGGLYIAAVAATSIILIILALIKPLEQKMFSRQKLRRILLTINTRKTSLSDIDAILRNNEVTLVDIQLHATGKPDEYQVKLSFDKNAGSSQLLAVTAQLQSLEA